MRAALIFVFLGMTFLGLRPAYAETTVYKIDASHTHVQFSVMRFGFNNVIGEFTAQTGQLILNEEFPEQSSVNVTIDTSSLESGDPLRNEHLAGEFWLDVTNHPEITFVSTSVDLTGEDTAKVTGDLTIKGITNEVTLDVKLNRIGPDPAVKKKAAGFFATTKISRAAFGISIAENLIDDDVTVRIEFLAHLVD